jgi:predicted nuclease of predicted toxin-antitoxin system
LEIAYTNNAVLITEDKDFGELAYCFQLKLSGILLVRMIEAQSVDKRSPLQSD